MATVNDTPSEKASGLDRITCKVIKRVATIISEFLSKIFDKTLSSGIFPDYWKKTNGLISILSVISKVFEKIVFNQFYDYLNGNNLFI